MLTIGLLYPELLGTYGDGGNATVLAERSRRRGFDASVVTVSLDDHLVAADLYVIGGGEDGPQRLASELLARESLRSRVDDGAFVFAVCAGLQILGTTFAVDGDDEYPGLGIVDAITRRGSRRAVGDFVGDVEGRTLVGFENHGGRTTLGPSVRPLARVVHGRGNDGRVDGFVTDQLWATYAHGPVLAQNPWLADDILSRVLAAPLDPLTSVADRLYAERCRMLSRLRVEHRRERFRIPGGRDR
jgi:CobQ-like glutamine amidotransferase family enzyme